jgi:hypothetical protein
MGFPGKGNLRSQVALNKKRRRLMNWQPRVAQKVLVLVLFRTSTTSAKGAE